MSERTDRLSSSHVTIRWPLFVVLAVVTVAVSLLSGLLAQAGAVQDARRPAAAAPLAAAGSVLTDTQVFLPLVSTCRLQGLAVSAPGEPGTMGLPQRFDAEIAAAGATTPLTYTWEATGLAPVVHSGGLTSTEVLTWELTGNKMVTVTVSNGYCSVRAAVPFEVTTRGMIVFERKTTDTDQHDLMLVHNEHTDVIFNLTNTPDVDEGGPAWSPDGNWIAYSAGDPLGGNRSIFKIDLRSGQVYSVTDSTTDDRWPAWSPDGTRIAYMRNQAGIPAGKFIPDIFVMDTDGGNQQQLTNWAYGDEYPAWSPDGQYIAFVSDRDYAGRDLYLMNADGSNEQILLLTPGMDEVYPTWGPEGWIYYTYRIVEGKDEWLYRMDPETSARVKVFDDNYNRYIASFAPDGLCFSFYSILGDTAGSDKEVWKWCDGYTQPVNLTDNDVSDEYSAWSPAP